MGGLPLVNKICQSTVYNWLIHAQHVVYPPVCLLCGIAGDDALDLCVGCRTDLPANDSPCGRCGLPLSGDARTRGVCGGCLRRPPPFVSATIPFLYRSPIDELIRGLKFDARLERARLLGMLLSRALTGRRTPSAIVPVPLHRDRLRARGFNQALEIGRPVGRALRIPVLSSALRRTHRTTPQTGLPAAARRRNVRGAFEAAAPLPFDRVALLDDVVTTGATIADAARACRRAGALEVEVWAVARTPD